MKHWIRSRKSIDESAVLDVAVFRKCVSMNLKLGSLPIRWYEGVSKKRITGNPKSNIQQGVTRRSCEEVDTN
jgi:hypothetical protein